MGDFFLTQIGLSVIILALAGPEVPDVGAG